MGSTIKRKASSINVLRPNGNSIDPDVDVDAGDDDYSSSSKMVHCPKHVNISIDDKTSMLAQKHSMEESVTDEVEMGQEQQPPLQKQVNMVREHQQQQESEEQGESNKVCEQKQQEQE